MPIWGSASLVSLANVIRNALNSAVGATFGSTRNAKELVTQTTAGVDETIATAYIAFRFITTETELGGFRVRLKRDGGVTAGQINSYLYNESAGSPGTNISDASTGLPALLYCVGLGTSYAEYEFRLPQTGMTIGNGYWIILNITGVVGGNIFIDRRTAGTNVWSTSANGSSWTTVSNKDAWIKVLGNAGRSFFGFTDTGFSFYGTAASGFVIRAINTGTGLAGKFDGTHQEGLGCTGLYAPGARCSSTFNHALQCVAGPNGLSGAQIITQAAGQPGAQIVSTSGPAVQLVPGTGAFLQILPLDASGGGVTQTLGWIAEELTLSGATTTDSVANLLPANSIIDSVGFRITQAISGGTATAFQIGTAADAPRFQDAGPALTLGTSGVGLNHLITGGHAVATVAATKIRVTLNGTSAAGKIRLVVFYRAFTSPSS